jgi:hypothetical protein
MYAETKAMIPQERSPGWTESPWIILPVMFLVLGPLALPMLWRSRSFTKAWKTIVTVVCLAYTVILVWYCAVVVQEVMRSLDQLDEWKKL